MGSIGIWQIIIVAVVVVLLFGRGKISELMGDMAKGIKSFRKGMSEDISFDEQKKIEPDNNSNNTINTANDKERQFNKNDNVG